VADDLLITAGFMRHCPCGAMAPAEQRCDQCGHSDDDEPDVVSFFDVHRCQAEATFDIPALDADDPPLQIRIAAVGGGTLGAAYADNNWIYEVRLAGTPVASGADLRCGGFARTHAQMAVTLAESLADTDQVPVLRRQRERLSRWARHDDHGGDHDD
jgi:hypothetical protein